MAASFWGRPGTRDPKAGDLAFIGWASATYLFINIFVRGSLAEFAASAFFPWLLWGMWLITAESGRFAAGAGVIAVSLTLLVLTHNAVALYAAILLVTVLPILFRPAGWRGWAAWAGGGAMAACLSAFFFVPFLLEREFIRLDNVAFTGFKDHFLRLGHLLSLTSWNLGTSGYGVSHTMPRHQGFLLPFALTGGAIALCVFKDSRLRRKTLILLALSLLTLAMTMSPSDWLWDNVRLLQLTQFPWRWLSLNATVLALLVPAFGLATRFRRTYLAAAATVLLLNVGLYGGPGPQWRRWEFDANPELIRAGKNRTAVDDEYGPVWRDTISFHPVPAGSPPWRCRVDARREEKEIIAGVNYFPGWKAFWLPDGSAGKREIPVEYSMTGLIQVRLPAGPGGQVELEFANTPLRLAMKLLSGVSLVVFLALAFLVIASGHAWARIGTGDGPRAADRHRGL
jgi:hypothetical protein